MASHISFNGQSYSSVNEMPPDIRRQYDAALQMLAQGARAAVNGSDPEVNVIKESDPGHHSTKTITTMTSRRFMVNGKEVANLDDVPPVIRAALENAIGHHDAPHGHVTHVVTLPDSGQSSRITVSLGTLVVLLFLAILAGVLIGWKFVH